MMRFVVMRVATLELNDNNEARAVCHCLALTHSRSTRYYRGTGVLVTRAVESGCLSHHLEVLDKMIGGPKGVYC